MDAGWGGGKNRAKSSERINQSKENSEQTWHHDNGGRKFLRNINKHL
jgi:hypothetical protein